MTLTVFNPSLLCATASYSPSRGFELQFPAEVQRSSPALVTFGAQAFKACSVPQIHDDSVRSDLSYLKRRQLVFTATLPFLLTLHDSTAGFRANAAGKVQGKSLISRSGNSENLRIREEVKKVVSKAKAAGVLRLAFHDAGTFELDDNSGGMNGSIMYELDRPENTGLKKSVKILAKAKSEVDAVQPVSWADMIALAGAEAVSICGGPHIPVALGRLDSLKPDPEGKLPEESLDAFGLKQCFQRKGLSTQELVALSGAHTLGSKGFGSPTVFDNSYYQILLQKPWMSSGGMSSMIGLPSDRALVLDDECLRWITKYADDQNTFFEDFKNAYIKLVNSGAKWKNLEDTVSVIQVNTREQFRRFHITQLLDYHQNQMLESVASLKVHSTR